MTGKRFVGSALVLALMLAVVAGLSVQLPQGGAQARDLDREPAPEGIAAPQASVGTAASTPLGTAASTPLGTAFTYQGYLTDGGSPAEGEYDFQFTLHDDPTADSPVAGPIAVEDQDVERGLFTVHLDFGQVFTGTARYLEIRVRPGDSAGAHTTLTPRQELTPAPYALALPGLWTQQNATSPNLIGGYSGNSVADGVVGATVGGGGQSAGPNQVMDSFATIGGGWHNLASGEASTIGGGCQNTTKSSFATIGGGCAHTVDGIYTTIGGGCCNSASSHNATVSGGEGNTASGASTTVSGGEDNTASGAYASIGGGDNNIAAGPAAAVPGGAFNQANGEFSLAAGYSAQALHSGTFVWADFTDAGFASTAADQFLVRASGGVGLGTPQPQNQLHVLESIDADADPQNHVAQIENGSTGTGPDVLALKVGTTGNPASESNFITFFKGDNTPIGAIEGDGGGGVTYKSGAGDLAEFLPRLDPREEIGPGDVVGVFEGRVSKATQGADRVLVVSARPVVLGNDPGDRERALYEPVAFVGQVEVKVRGPVAAGDWIVPSGLGDGSAVAVPPEAIIAEQAAQVVGQAWESCPEAGLKGVRVAVGLPLPGGVAARDVQDLQAENDALRQQVNDLEARLAALERGSASRSPAFGLPGWLLLGGLGLVGGVVLQRRRPGGGQ